MLKIANLTIKSATRTVINDVSIEVPEGQIVALLGPNGAGKSELVLGVAGVMPVAAGTVTVDGMDVTGRSASVVRGAGIAAVPEGHQVLPGLSIIDNLRAAGPMHDSATLETEVAAALEVFPELSTISNRTAGALSGGQQQMVALAQALVAKPRFLLIDEMSLGLAPVIIDRLIGVIQELRQRQIGILLIEQFTQLALDVADRCYVLARGEIQFEGAAADLKADPTILERAYLGA